MKEYAVQPGKILILNGASSSGKTSLVRALQETLAEPYLEAGLDKFIWMLPRRYLERPLWDDVLGLAVEPGETGRRLVSGMHAALLALALDGWNVIADHVLVEREWVLECAGMFAELPAYLIAVRCPLDVLVEREKQRRDRTLGQAAAQFERVHSHSTYDFEVDTSRSSPQEAARQIASFLETNPPPRALRQIGRR